MQTAENAEVPVNKQRRLLVRADASAEIGTGHVMRCLALAQTCQARNVNVQFAVAECPEAIRQRVKNNGIGVLEVKEQSGSTADCAALLDLAGEQSAKWVVLDGYRFATEYQRQVRDSGYKLLVVDDYSHLEEYDADALLNQNLGAAAELYPRINPDCRLLLGPRYALLRKEFWPWKDWQREIPQKAKKLLVMMGGSDPEGVTLKVLQTLEFLPDPSLQVRVLVGAANPRKDEIMQMAHALPMKLDVQRDVRNMPELLAWADLAVSASGSTCWELLFMGNPSMISPVADNQARLFAELVKRGLMVSLGEWRDWDPEDGAKRIKSLLHSHARRADLSRQGRQLVSWQGANRVLDQLLPVQISLRPASWDDAQRIWDWANDPQTRQVSFHGARIAWEEHADWFRRRLADGSSILLVADVDETPAGFIRFELSEEYADISVNLSPAVRGRGFGQTLLRRALHRLGCERPVRAFIKPDNKASITTFERAGFQFDGQASVNSQTALLYVLRGAGKGNQS